MLYNKHKQEDKKQDELIDISELNDIVDLDINKTLGVPNSVINKGDKNQSVDQVKITNIFVNNNGTKSLDMKGQNIMLRDIKALNLITQRAMTTNSKNNSIDCIDDKKSFMQFGNIGSRKALFIDDNSDMPSGIGSLNNTDDNDSNLYELTSPNISERQHIINIININNNYNIGNLNYAKTPLGNNKYNYTNAHKKPFNTTVKKPITSINPSDFLLQQESAKSNMSSKTSIKSNIPKTKVNKSIKEIINSCQKKPITKEKFVRINK
jgi:hypothetical protein